MKKTIIISCLSLSIFGAMGTTNANAAELVVNESGEIRPYISWSGNAYLTTKAYSNVTSSNNIFTDSPVVTNASGNKGTIKVKVVNEKGEQVGGVKEVAPGKSVRLDKIPFGSGTYTIKAQAVDKEGTYLISID